MLNHLALIIIEHLSRVVIVSLVFYQSLFQIHIYSNMGEQQEETNATWRVEKGRLHRKRVKTFPNGNVYNCEFVGDKPDGYGTFTSQGMKYEGNFLNGLFHGAAKIVWTDESNRIVKTFTGEFKCGKRFGYGVLSDDREKWEGNFANDKFHGEGTLWKKDGDRLKGEWKNGKFQCKDGLIVFRNGDKYEGPVHHGQLHGGVGHYSYRDGGSYTGHYSYNVPNGIGTRTFVDGTTFRGDFRNGKFHGHGIRVIKNNTMAIGLMACLMDAVNCAFKNRLTLIFTREVSNRENFIRKVICSIEMDLFTRVNSMRGIARAEVKECGRRETGLKEIGNEIQ